MSVFASHLSNGLFLSFVVGIPFYATRKKIEVFEVFIQGAKQGFETTISIVPYLVAMIVAIGMLRASGFFELMAVYLWPIFEKIGFPSALLPLVLVRPFSGSASNGVLAELIHHEGGNALISKMATTLMGSTDTTLYIVAVYFGAVQIQRTRYAIPVGLLAELVAVVASVVICHLLF